MTSQTAPGDYQHRWKDGTAVHCATGKIVCVGRNYAAHAAELDNPVPDQPLLFMKPSTAACYMTRPVSLAGAGSDIHYETELAVLIGSRLSHADEPGVQQAILGYGLALDLTLRALQSELKNLGHPWERAKAFDGACPLSPFIPAAGLDARELQFTLEIDDALRQNGHVKDMLHPVLALIAQISEVFTLMPGDVVLTGTPAGVGPLAAGQCLALELFDTRQGLPPQSLLFVSTRVAGG